MRTRELRIADAHLDKLATLRESVVRLKVARPPMTPAPASYSFVAPEDPRRED